MPIYIRPSSDGRFSFAPLVGNGTITGGDVDVVVVVMEVAGGDVIVLASRELLSSPENEGGVLIDIAAYVVAWGMGGMVRGGRFVHRASKSQVPNDGPRQIPRKSLKLHGKAYLHVEVPIDSTSLVLP
jgi:hypothetical protein